MRSSGELRAIIPILPSRDLVKTRAFYERLGFRTTGWWPQEFGGYAILVREGVELHFCPVSGFEPGDNYAACYWRVRDVAAVHAQCRALVAVSEGIPRITGLEDQPWGMREFALVDPDGNLLRIGEENS
jgi:catechol 2,3-dioxygenase-like lactoylglutathione lyase family enzyme